VGRLGVGLILKDYMNNSNNKSVWRNLKSEIRREKAERREHQRMRDAVAKREKEKESSVVKFKKEQQKIRESEEMLRKYLEKQKTA